MPEYAVVLIFLLLVTVGLHKYFKVKLYKSVRHLVLVNTILLPIGIIWDQYAIWRGHWTFNPKFLLGIKIGYMPIEEYAFMIIVFYFGLTVYKIIEKKYLK